MILSFSRLFGKRSSPKSMLRQRKNRRRPRRPDRAILAVEQLEDRTLMSVIPPITVIDRQDISLSDVSDFPDNESAPSIAINPIDSNKLAAVWMHHSPDADRDQQVFISGAYSNDGGVSWFALNFPTNLIDPTSVDEDGGGDIEFYAEATDPTIAFDRDNHFYVVYAQHSADNTSGAVVLDKFDFSGFTPTLSPAFTSEQLYTWLPQGDRQDAALNPVMVVDSTLPEFTDPDSGEVIVNPYAGNIYIAWNTNNGRPTGFDEAPGPLFFNPNAIMIVASSDGGYTFTTQRYINDSGSQGGRFERDALPRLVVSQGTADGVVAPGQVTLFWNNYNNGTLASANPTSTILSDRILNGGTGAVFSATNLGTIQDAIGENVPIFFPSTHYDVGNEPRGVATGDFNGDGNADIVSVDRLSDQVTVLFNDGFGSFNSSLVTGSAEVGNDPYFVVAGDFDGDGFDDIAVLVPPSGVTVDDPNNVYSRVRILLNNGAGAFTFSQELTVGRQGNSIAVADFNGDSSPDLAIANRTENTISVFLGGPGGIFTLPVGQTNQGFLAGISPVSIIAGDFLFGGQVDLVVVNNNSLVAQNIRAIRGNGDGTFDFNNPETWTAGTNVVPEFVRAGNFDAGTPGDDGIDLAILVRANANVQGVNANNVQIFLRDDFQPTTFDEFRFAAPTTVAVGNNPSSVAIGDFNGDIFLDIVATNRADNNVTVLIGDGQGAFQADQTVYVTEATPMFSATGFFNADARPDVAIANQVGDSVTVLLTDSIDLPNSPKQTTYVLPVEITDPKFDVVTDLDVTLAIRHEQVGELAVFLEAPNGTVVPLFLNATNNAGDETGNGIDGENLGIHPGQQVGANLRTTFDQEAARTITDATFTGGNRALGTEAPYIGHYRPEAGSLASFYGLRPVDLEANGIWKLHIIDFVASNATGGTDASQQLPQLELFELHFTSGLTDNSDTTVAFTGVLGPDRSDGGSESFGDGFYEFPRQSNVDNIRGIGPGIAVAADNTLGSFSPFQGRIYLAFVDHFNLTGNPVDNTEIRLAYSDNGGLSWSGGAFVVNDDDANIDGYTEALSAGNFGRAQFQPQVAVDQATGTLVVSWLDARDDASRSRVAYYHASSIDGGDTFSPQTFVNVPHTAIDAITNETVVIGPVPDNISPGNAARNDEADAVWAGFGDHQGLAVHNGQIFSVWAGNLNGWNTFPIGGFRSTTDTETNQMDIMFAHSTIAVGPAIVESDMGPITTDFSVSTSTGTLIYNNTFDAPSGIRQLDSFVVEFDRPVAVDSFGIEDIVVEYRNPVDDAVSIVDVSEVVALNAGLFDVFAPGISFANDDAMATRFRVIFSVPQIAVGTYSYSVGPEIQDRIRTAVIELAGSSQIDSFASGPVSEPIPDASLIPQPPGQPPIVDPGVATSTISVSAFPAEAVITDVNVSFSIDHPSVNQLQVTLIGPDGTRVRLVTNRGNGNNFTAMTFDDEAATPIASFSGSGTYRPETSQPGFGPGGNFLSNLDGMSPNGDWILEVRDTVVFTTGTLESWSLRFVTDTLNTNIVSGNFMDQDADSAANETDNDAYSTPYSLAGNPFSGPFLDYTLPLVVPGPHILSQLTVALNTTTGATEIAASNDNLVGNASVNAINVTFDRKIANEPSNPSVSTFTEADILRIFGPAGQISGPFKVTKLSDTTFQITFPTQVLSGTYTVVLGPNITDTVPVAFDPLSGAPIYSKLDTNLNAGVDKLFGRATLGLSTQTYSTDFGTPRPIDAETTTFYELDVLDDFVIRRARVQVDITFPNVPDLEAWLQTPDGTQIPLFSFVGAPGSQDFEDTIFDDNADTPIQSGGAPYNGSFTPQMPLSVLNNTNSVGTYYLVIRNTSSSNVGTLNHWRLLLDGGIAGSGLGEAVADQVTNNFRIFTMDSTNPLTQQVWTAVGPASISQSGIGRVTGLAVDPSDPSGNTVYVAGASGGVWKTTNFLTRDTQGPTYQPLTDSGPTLGVNIGGLAVFGRNNDPRQSIIFAVTGEGDTASPGVGFLRSMDGGATWTLLDSTNNVDASGNPLPINSGARDHIFVGSTSFDVIVDPTLSPQGEVIVYAAIGNGNARGVWRSTNTGKTWERLLIGEATDVHLAPNSRSESDGTLQQLYVAFRENAIQGDANGGVYLNTAAPDSFVFEQMLGDTDNPLIGHASNTVYPIGTPVDASDDPDGKLRITLSSPFLTGNPLQDQIYEGWLFALAALPGGNTAGLYVTKDYGQNWTRVQLPIVPDILPTNDDSRPDLRVLGHVGNYAQSLTVDPNNPNIVYVGGTVGGLADPAEHNLFSSLIRVDLTRLQDAHALVGQDFDDPGPGTITCAGTAAAVILFANRVCEPYGVTDGSSVDAYGIAANNYFNLIRHPVEPFLENSTISLATVQEGQNVRSFRNDGSGVRFTDFNLVTPGVPGPSGPVSLASSAPDANHRIVAMRDPVTGQTRLIMATDNGVFTQVDDGTGFLSLHIGADRVPFTVAGERLDPTRIINGSRNGNLQIAQFYYGAAQPSSLAANIAQSLFYGASEDNGTPRSVAGMLNPSSPDFGNISWRHTETDPTPITVDRQTVGSVSTDQTGSGFAYHTEQYGYVDSGVDPSIIDTTPDIFEVSRSPGNVYIARTFGLYQNLFDDQWDIFPPNFAVNPLSGNQIVMSSHEGRIFRSLDQGRTWFVIGQPSNLDPDGTGPRQATYAQAIAFGAPAVGASTNQYANFIYAGTEDGEIFVTFTGGGTATSAWKRISAGLDGSPIRAIVTNPTRGSREAYAVTERGVYYMVNSGLTAPSWVNITNGLFAVRHNSFGNASLSEFQMRTAMSLAADWRFMIPDNPYAPNGAKHPILYVGGDGGVYRSTDKGVTWQLFPSVSQNGAPVDGGLLPNAPVTDLDLVLGNINPTTGRPDETAGFNMLVATTYGRGTFAIRLSGAAVQGPADPPTNESLRVITIAVGSDVADLDSAFPSGRPVGPDTAPNFPMNSVLVRFSGRVDPTSFTVADVVSFTRPNGAPIAVTGVVDITPTSPNGQNLHNIWQLTFADQITDGTYTLVIGPNITDGSGQKMDQDGDKVRGEAIADRFTGKFVINSTDNGRFIAGLFHDLLGRDADTALFTTYLNQIDTPRLAAARTQATSIVNTHSATACIQTTSFGCFDLDGSVSTANRSQFVTEVYDFLLTPDVGPTRVPTAAELSAGVAALGRAPVGSLSAVEQYIISLVGTAEYFSQQTEDDFGSVHFGLATNRQWVENVYADLNVTPPGGAVDSRENAIFSAYATQRNAVVFSVTTGNEYRARLINLYHIRFLNRPATATEINALTNEMRLGRTDEQIMSKIFGSAEYYNLKGTGVTANDRNTSWINALETDVNDLLRVTSFVIPASRKSALIGDLNFNRRTRESIANEVLSLSSTSQYGYRTSLVNSLFTENFLQGPYLAGDAFSNDGTFFDPALSFAETDTPTTGLRARLNAGVSDERMIAILLSGVEYFKRQHLFPFPPAPESHPFP